MSDHTDIYLNNPDPLSSLLFSLELTSEVYVSGEFCEPWAVDTSGSKRIPFHLVSGGHAWLHVTHQPPRRIAQGDLVLFPHDSPHVLSDSEKPPDKAQINQFNPRQDGAITNLICGFMDFDSPASQVLLDSLPQVIVLDLSDLSGNPSLRMLIDYMVNELKVEKPGYYAAINQLAYLLFIEIIRAQMTQGQLSHGLLAGLFDPRLCLSLQAMHNHPEISWSLEDLAHTANMSRSAFASHFHGTVGIPPMQYLTSHRMGLARQQLIKTNKSIVEIAESCGYETDAAFRKAFKRVVGQTPGEVRRNFKQ